MVGRGTLDADGVAHGGTGGVVLLEGESPWATRYFVSVEHSVEGSPVQMSVVPDVPLAAWNVSRSCNAIRSH